MEPGFKHYNGESQLSQSALLPQEALQDLEAAGSLLSLAFKPSQTMTQQTPLQDLKEPEEFPLPLKGHSQEPEAHINNWWKLQSTYHQYLLQLHPDHPTHILPEQMEYHLLQGPVAQTAMLLRSLTLAYRKTGYQIKEGLPSWVKLLLPYTKEMTTLKFWECIFIIWMPILTSSLTAFSWNLLHNLLTWMLHAMAPPSHSNTGSTTYSESNFPNLTKQLSNPITKEYVEELRKYGGEVWITSSGPRIDLPPMTWEDYGCNRMGPKSKRRFIHTAWPQLVQFMYDTSSGDSIYNLDTQVTAGRQELIKALCISHVFRSGFYKDLGNWVYQDKRTSNGEVRMYDIGERGLSGYHTIASHLSGNNYSKCDLGHWEGEDCYRCDINKWSNEVCLDSHCQFMFDNQEDDNESVSGSED